MVRNFLGPVLGQSGRTELPNVRFSCFGEFVETYFITECLQIDPRTSKGSQWGPQGSPPHGIPWAPRVSLPRRVLDPLPWDSMGPQGFPPPCLPCPWPHQTLDAIIAVMGSLPEVGKLAPSSYRPLDQGRKLFSTQWSTFQIGSENKIDFGDFSGA